MEIRTAALSFGVILGGILGITSAGALFFTLGWLTADETLITMAISCGLLLMVMGLVYYIYGRL